MRKFFAPKPDEEAIKAAHRAIEEGRRHFVWVQSLNLTGRGVAETLDALEDLGFELLHVINDGADAFRYFLKRSRESKEGPPRQ